jgi:hypothetical protein
MTNLTIEEMIENEASRWDDCSNSSEITLLRLVILRRLIQDLHSEKSRCLGGGLKTQALAIRDWEMKIDELRECASLNGNLMEMIQKSKQLPKKSRVLPEALFRVIDRNKLVRYDRQWECAMISEGLSQGWNVWMLESWVKISSITRWELELVDKLWPHGVILFAESAEQNQYHSSADSNEPTLWKGRWLCLLQPELNHSKDLLFNDATLLNPSTQLPDRPEWKRLFP